MSESIEKRLSRFTPDPTGLDRDALLFAAGRASARPSRRWIALTAALAASQLLTLLLLWPRPAPPDRPTVADTAPPVVAPAPPDQPAPAAPSSLLVLRQQFLDEDDNEFTPRPVSDLVSDAPPLRAFSVSSDIFSN